MSVTVDHQPLAAEKLGLQTIGQVLAHLKRDNRLVVHVLLDGEEPDPSRLTALKQLPLNDHTLYIETAEPRRLALDALNEVEEQLAEADRLKRDAVNLLQSGTTSRAMEKLSGCFSTWSHAQEAMEKTAQLLRIEPSRIVIDGRTLPELNAAFADQLRAIRSALENRDYVSLCDTLEYETSITSDNLRRAIAEMRSVIS
jgi:hypothetical protein